MPSEQQASFFARISAALGERNRSFELPESLEAARVVSPEADVAETFIERAKLAGMHPHCVAGDVAAVAKVLEVAGDLSAKSAIVPADDTPLREEIVAALQSAGIKLLDADDPDAGFEADIGITGVRMAVAETASMSVISGGEHRRLASLAVPAHIALVRAGQIVADLLDWGSAAEGEPCANEVLISAMSKTADIEGILVPGVHGPGTVHVIVID